MTITAVSQASGNVGTVQISGNQIVFTMTERFAISNFSYTVSDGKGGQASAVVTLLDP